MSPNGSDRSPRRPMRRKLLQALTAGLVLATATGCTWEDFPRLGMPTPTTEEAPIVLSLWQGSWAAALAVGVLVWGLILWSAFFHRRSRTKVEIPPQTRYNVPIEALYTVVPIIIVSVLFYFTARDESKLLDMSKKPDVTVNVVGFQWSWCFNYIEDVEGSTGDAKTAKELDSVPERYKKDFPDNAGGVYTCGTPGERNPQTGNPGPTLWLPEGKTVRFVLTSRDVIHSFWVVPFLMKQDVIPGHPNAFQVTPNRQGTFLGKCAELCGVDHSRMLFNVKVVSEERYEQHLKELAEKGQTGYVPSGIEQTDHERNREANIL
ncbi:aa3-type cytochrome oxidase subunit II [Streptomyces chromofuscus]|uniref:Probable cytochrome c oxidase subunit 2 n=1 Tax=Streptomyces chromofuscus TaxID=42881 RepID=A0A7M2TCK7_STRCW|nr:cytochrome c oxidase subunit II [Streptomyces chromofuscus]QOV46232.1 cytochrome c oxidase subunit II [Streptomyces chromofuscus]GGS96230.1 putative cytochrome c oxidase subunit 2 [Streptomyces chromofuscus]